MWQDMWQSWPEQEIAQEVAMFPSLGINCVRILVPYSDGGWNGACNLNARSFSASLLFSAISFLIWSHSRSTCSSKPLRNVTEPHHSPRKVPNFQRSKQLTVTKRKKAHVDGQITLFDWETTWPSAGSQTEVIISFLTNQSYSNCV